MLFKVDDQRISSSNIAPITINDDGSFETAGSHTPMTLTLTEFVKKAIADFDFSPPYQRDECWTADMQANLIISILSGRPIPSIYLASKKSNVAKYNAVDGKQRSIAILRFALGHLKVPLKIDGDIKYMSYKDIENQIESGNEKLLNLRNKFDSFKVDAITYQGLNLVGQCKLFDDINTFRPITNDEALLGNNYYLKAFLRVMLNEIKPLLRHVKQVGKKNGKNKEKTYDDQTLTYIGRILFTCFGRCMTDGWKERDLGLGKAKTSSDSRPFNIWIREMNEYLAGFIEESNLINLDWNSLNKMTLFKNAECFVKTCHCVKSILEAKNTVKKEVNKNDILDIICFIIKNIEHNIVTLAMLKDSPQEWLHFIYEYVKEKNIGKGGNLTGQSVTLPMLRKRFSLIEDVFKRCKFDIGVKNKLQTQIQDTIARLESDSNCPVNGSALSDDNYATDHIDPKSLSSETQFAGISKIANLKKSNNTRENVDKMKDYISKKVG